MNELHAHRTFTYSRGHALHRSMPHISDCKNPGNIRLKQKRIPVERPSLRTLAPTHQVRTGEDKSAVITLDRVAHPIRAWQRADKDKHRACRNALDFVCIGTENRNFFQMRIAVDFRYAGMSPHL